MDNDSNDTPSASFKAVVRRRGPHFTRTLFSLYPPDSPVWTNCPQSGEKVLGGLMYSHQAGSDFFPTPPQLETLRPTNNKKREKKYCYTLPTPPSSASDDPGLALGGAATTHYGIRESQKKHYFDPRPPSPSRVFMSTRTPEKFRSIELSEQEEQSLLQADSRKLAITTLPLFAQRSSRSSISSPETSPLSKRSGRRSVMKQNLARALRPVKPRYFINDYSAGSDSRRGSFDNNNGEHSADKDDDTGDFGHWQDCSPDPLLYNQHCESTSSSDDYAWVDEQVRQYLESRELDRRVETQSDASDDDEEGYFDSRHIDTYETTLSRSVIELEASFSTSYRFEDLADSLMSV